MNYVSWDAKFDPRLIRSKPRVDLFGGWLQAGALLYRLTDGLIPFNRDEISVTMAEGSRDRRALAARAAQLREIFNGVVWPEPRE
ncbi:hypothetical protein WS67_12035 [Burkholderia singularis]|uniref:Uncharacterized protein n=2 Tax=Burkholderiaceae TaxID=119060 RepID=A0A103E368_9BURK|nr:hypothetical protein WS67_12035 [Burkholderia singularis]KVE33720.1 hypothetical protein WS68_11130 [Burkholderia sp. TSV86]